MACILVERGLPFLQRDCQGQLRVPWGSTIFKLVGQGGLSKKTKGGQKNRTREYRGTHQNLELNACA